ncbi:MAG TPA: hypothetical protein VIE89_20850 [Candidatus Binatia bacterium]
MSLRLQRMKVAELPLAGMDGRHPAARDASGDIHVAWIPALHAGMTELRDRSRLTQALRPSYFRRSSLISRHKTPKGRVLESAGSRT